MMPQEIKDILIGTLKSKLVWAAMLGVLYNYLNDNGSELIAMLPAQFKAIVVPLYPVLILYLRLVTTQSLAQKGAEVREKKRIEINKAEPKFPKSEPPISDYSGEKKEIDYSVYFMPKDM